MSTEDSVALKSEIRLKLARPVSADVCVMDAFGKPLEGAQVQMRVSTRPDEAWWTVGKTDSNGGLKADKLYRNGPYGLRAMLKGYKDGHTSSLPKVGSKAWMSTIEIVMEKAE